MARAASRAVIEANELTRLYRNADRPALNRIDLRVEPGEFVFLTGESGSGKTTLIRALLLEEQDGAGTLKLFGRDVRRLGASKKLHVRQHIGSVFQDYKLIADMSVRNNVAFPLACWGESSASVETRVREALELVGLADRLRARPGELSGGEQQRVAIARALVGRPALLLADEPTGNLDPASSGSVFDLLEEINRAGTTVLVATHDDATVNRLARRVVRLEKGEILFDRHGGYH